MTKITLRGITSENMGHICALKVTEEQNKFVAPNPISLAQARFCDNAWYRAIYADETPVGFLMVYDNPAEGEYYLWRFMIDQRHQGKGYGKEAMGQLIEHIKARPRATALTLSCVPAEDGPEPMYLKLGFVPTGEMDGDEKVMILRWAEEEQPRPLISLKPITGDVVRDLCKLKVAEHQKDDVIDNPNSLAESLFNSLLQFRAVYASDTAVGFVMWEDNPEKGEYFLWRLMIGEEHQGKGYGREAIEQLIELIRNRPRARELLTSFIPGSNPQGFYTKLGFTPTERFIDDEQVFTHTL